MTTLMLIWPLLNVNLRSLGLIWLGTACYLKTTQLLSYLVKLGELWMSELPGRTPATHFWRQIRRLDRKTKKCLTLFTAISSDKRYLISMLLHWRQDSKDFPPGSGCGIKGWKNIAEVMDSNLALLIISAQEIIIKVRERIPYIGPLTKVIPLELFLEIVPSSSAEITRAFAWMFSWRICLHVCFQSKGKPPTLLGCLLWHFDYNQGSFGSRYVLLHFETLIVV